MADDTLLNQFAQRKKHIDTLADELRNQISNKAQQIRANPNDPNVPKWQAEMSQLQQRLRDEPEAGTYLLCEDIKKATGAKDVFKRNTDATNLNLKGEEWAKYVLAGTGSPS